MPFLPAISLAVAAMGILNAENKYTAPALASSMFNLVAIAGGVTVFFVAPSARAAVMAWAGLTLVGGVAQLAIQAPPLYRMGFRPRLLPDLRLRDPGARRIATLMAPATLGVAAVQVNVFVNSNFASFLGDKRYNDLVDDFSQQAIDKNLEQSRVFLGRFEAIDIPGSPNRKCSTNN
jgi:putative peptidoglycan lipid II flippase